MANNSIKAAFERMWQHVVAQVSSSKTEALTEAKAYTDATLAEVSVSGGNSIYYSVTKGVASPDGDWEFDPAKVDSYSKQIHAGDFIINNQLTLFRVKSVVSGIFCDRIGDLKGSPGAAGLAGSKIYYASSEVAGTSNPDGDWEIVRSSVQGDVENIKNGDIIIDRKCMLFEVTNGAAGFYILGQRLGGLVLEHSDITRALGYTPANQSNFKTETWTFELEDGSTLTKRVVIK